MLAFVEQLSEVNVEGVEPMTSVTPMAMKKRADVVTDGGIAERHRQERASERGSFLPGAEGGRIMCIACELNFWNMIDALPPEDQERVLREQAKRFACERARASRRHSPLTNASLP